MREEVRGARPSASRRGPAGHPDAKSSKAHAHDRGMAGLQATAGNAAVARMLRSVQRAPAASPPETDTAREPDDVAAAQAYIDQHLPDLADWAREETQRAPYHRMTDGGEFWQPELEQGAPPGRAFIAARSQENITGMERELAPDDGWQDAVRTRLEAALAGRELHHYTTRHRAEAALGPSGSGSLDSKTKLIADHPDEYVHHNTEDTDEDDLANDAFVFFFIGEAGAPFRRTRFSAGDESGPARIALPMNRVTESGWVMLNDFVEIEHPTLRSNAEGELLSYRRDEADADQFHSPEGQAVRAGKEIKRLWRHFPELNRRAHHLTRILAHSPDPSDSRGVLALAHLLKDIKGTFAAAGVTGRYQELTAKARTELARGARFGNQVRRFNPNDGTAELPEHGVMRYMKGDGHRGRADAEAARQVKEYKEYFRNNTLAGPHALRGLALRGVLEISRIERQGGNEALVNRLKSMSGDQLADVLLKDFIRPQVMLPWSVAITRGDVQYP